MQPISLYFYFSESLFMAKSAFWGLSAEVFISIAPFGLSINLMLESVISIYNHYWWRIVPKTCNIPVESRKQVKMTYFFEVNFRLFMVKKIMFDIHHNLHSNTQAII